MTQNNEQAKDPENKLDDELKNCRMRLVGCTGLVECLTEGVWCQWVMPFGNSRFCNHPGAKDYLHSHPQADEK